MDIKSIFISSKGKIISGESIADKIGISRIAVWKRIRSLKNEGFCIKSVKNKGYILCGIPDIIDQSRVKVWLKKSGAENFFGGIKYIYNTDSTQTLAKRLAETNVINSLIIIAEKQSTSYGRLGRKWISPKGGLWFSILMKPRMMPQQATLLTLIFSLAIRDVAQSYAGTELFVKWPNDIYTKDKKMCGILTELSAELDATKWIVIGVGLNVNNSIAGSLKKTAISLEMLAGRKLDRTEILIKTLDNFKKRYSLFVKNGFKEFRGEYRKKSLWFNKDVEVKTTDGRVFHGKNCGIDENGFLSILGKNRKKTMVPSGDLFRHRDRKKSSSENTKHKV